MYGDQQNTRHRKKQQDTRPQTHPPGLGLFIHLHLFLRSQRLLHPDAVPDMCAYILRNDVHYTINYDNTYRLADNIQTDTDKYTHDYIESSSFTRNHTCYVCYIVNIRTTGKYPIYTGADTSSYNCHKREIEREKALPLISRITDISYRDQGDKYTHARKVDGYRIEQSADQMSGGCGDHAKQNTRKCRNCDGTDRVKVDRKIQIMRKQIKSHVDPDPENHGDYALQICFGK